jgi:hypothetical protein
MLRVAVGYGFDRAVMRYVYMILRGKDLETGIFSEERRSEQFNILQQAQAIVLDLTNWHEFLKTIKTAGYTHKSYISSRNNTIYSYVLFLIGKKRFKMEHFQLRKLIARWYFMTAMTGRYTGSPESQMEFDLSKLRGVTTASDFEAILNETISTVLTDDFWSITLPNSLATSSPTSPSLFAYYASLNIHRALGLFSQLQISDLLQEGLKAKKSPLERHHLFPKAYLKKQGINDVQQTNQIANYALVEWADNIAISDNAPFEYLPKYLIRFRADDLQAMYYWHALPNSWEDLSYDDFLKQRRILIGQVIRDAFEKL